MKTLSKIIQQIRYKRALKRFRNTVESGDKCSVRINGVFFDGIVRIAADNGLSVYVSGFGYNSYQYNEIYPPISK